MLLRILFCLSLLSNALDGRSSGLPKGNKLFFVGIGIDSMMGPGNKPMQFRYCVSDARKMASYFGFPVTVRSEATGYGRTHELSTDTGRFRQYLSFRESNKATRIDSAEAYLFSNSGASYAAIKEVIEAISKRMSGNDLFVFYYAGASQKVLLADKPQFANREDIMVFPLGAYLPSSIDSLSQLSSTLNSLTLKTLLNQVSCRKQLVIFDTDEGNEFFPSFSNYAFENDLSLNALLSRERVYLFTIGSAPEVDALGGGLLTYSFCKMERTDLKDLFSPDASQRMAWEGSYSIEQSRLYSNAATTLPSFHAAVRFEKDFIEFARRMKASEELSRGINAPVKSAAAQPRARGRNYALLIGTDIYDAPSWGKLNNPVNDASTIEKELRETYGFNTELLKNPTRREILEALRKYKNRIRYDSTSELFIFIAGHGGIDDFVNGFIATRDSKDGQEDFARDSYLTHAQLRDIINSIDCNHILVALDVCFGGSFDDKISGSTSRSGEERYAAADTPAMLERKLRFRSRLYLTSGGREYVPDGRPGMHSPFAYKLIETLRKGGKDRLLTFSEIKAALERVVPEPRAGGFGSNEPGGDFIFLGL
ncbi:caspase family protein [Flaviaesturariibacter terrae]